MPIEYFNVNARDSWNNWNTDGNRTEPLEIESSYSTGNGGFSMVSSEAYITFALPQVARPENVLSAKLNIYPIAKRYYNIDTTWSTINVLSQPSGVLLGKTAFKNIPAYGHFHFYLNVSSITDLAQLLIDKYKHSTDSKQNSMAVDVSSSRTSQPPSLEIEYGNVQLVPVNCSPMVGLVMRDTEAVFNWDYSSDIPDASSQPTYLNAKFAWKIKGQTNVKELQTNVKSVVLPANTLPRGEIEWRVTINSNFGSMTSDWFTVSTIDSLSTVQPISPRSIYLVGNEPNTFVWKHIISTGTLQTAAELQTSPNGQTWKTIANITGGVQQCVVPAGALGGDVRFWRVRTYNRDSVAGQWSEPVPIVVYAAPRPPTLALPEGTPLLTITWQSSEQQAYETKAGDWQSGPIYGTTKIYTFPQWFSDGSTVVGVRVQSSLGLWSEWATAKVIVTNQPQGEVRLSARAVTHGVILNWIGEHAAYIIYRDGVDIGSTTSQSFVDWLTSGKHRYAVRGINGRYYSISNMVTEYSISPHGVISTLPDIKWLPLQYRRGDSPTRSSSTGKQVELQYYRGRSKPVAEVAEQIDTQHTIDYSLQKPEDVAQLKRMVGTTIIYKGPENVAIIGTLLAVAEEGANWSGVDVSLTITETDWKEDKHSANI